MSYFGGLGAGRGWHKFKFILKPERLNSIFQNLNYWFFITNTRVPIDYEISQETTFFDDYETFFNRVVSGKEWNKKEDWAIESPIRVSITNNLDSIKFEDIKNRKGEISSEFKLVRPSEPVVNIRPFYTYFKNGKLSIETSNDEGVLGLELSYPKVVSFGSEGHEYLYETEQFSGFELLTELVKRTKKLSHKAKLTCNEKTYRPNFWVDNKLTEEINNNSYLKKNSLILK
nr:hypothetical protein [uncultured Allomuricauda sp.]